MPVATDDTDGNMEIAEKDKQDTWKYKQLENMNRER